MRFAMLARNPALLARTPLLRRRTRAATTIDVINTLHVHMNITSNQPVLRYNGRRCRIYDAVIPRIGASITHYGLAVLRQFEMQGVYPLNESVAIGRSRDKLRALQILAREGIGLPVTAFAHGPRKAEDVIKEVGGTPSSSSSWRAPRASASSWPRPRPRPSRSSRRSARPTSTSWCRSSSARPNGSDIRAFVIGGEVVAGMKRVGTDGRVPRQHASRRQRGARSSFPPRSAARQCARPRRSASTSAGVDMVRSARGPLVMEVNSSPGLQGIESATGIDVADLIIGFLEANASYGKTETKGVG